MTVLRVEPGELANLAASIRALRADLAALPHRAAIDGGGGTPPVDDGVATFGAFTGSRLRHLEHDLDELADRLGRAAHVYEAADGSAARAVSTGGADGGRRLA